jgi:lysophospholipid acyltransferase (LPLAT)-like uncharacterized protein
MPINIEYSSCWRARNWDRFIVPKPFSSVHVTFADLHYVAQTSSDEEFEAERKRLEDVLMGLVQRR